jgi:hypothetical protein
MPDRSEMDKWLIGLDPNLKAAFDATYDMLETTKKALPAVQTIGSAEGGAAGGCAESGAAGRAERQRAGRGQP